MIRPLKKFADGEVLCFDIGKDDKWRVSFYKNGKYIMSPRDTWLFRRLLAFSDNEWVMEQVYSLGRQMPLGGGKREVLFKSLEIPKENGRESKSFSALGATMISEEMKILSDGKPSKVGALIKVIGCYQVLALGWNPLQAAEWSKGRGAYEIKKWAKNHGILQELQPAKQLSLGML